MDNRYQRALNAILTDRPIAYHGCLARAGGGVQSGVFLAQLLYWTPRGKLENGWVWKKKEEWSEETGMTIAEIDSARKELKKRGILEEKLAGVPATLHYRVNIQRLSEIITDGYEEEKREQPRDDKGRFIPDHRDTENCPSSPHDGELDTRDTENKIPVSRRTRSPQHGDLSIDDTETTREDTSYESAEKEIDSFGLTGDLWHEKHDKEKPPSEKKERGDWLTWATESKVLGPRYGVEQRYIQRVGHLLEERFGLVPPIGNKPRMKHWVNGCAELYQASDGDIKVIKQAGDQLRENGMMLSKPQSFYNAVVAIMSERRSGGDKDGVLRISR